MLIVHLSDIHFRAQDGDALDPNADLRRELENDLRRLRAQFGRSFDALAITGDIAFSGKTAEFLVAQSWITSLCELIDCPATGVMLSPGNHDVDRSVVSSAPDIQTFHSEMRSRPVNALDDYLALTLREQGIGDRVLLPLAAYNEFAAKYGCECGRAKPWWAKSLTFAPTRTVTFRGVNTALISGPNDHRETGKLVMGTVQCSLPRGTGTIHVVLGHHPPSWLRDQEAVERALARHAALQLFGHRHEQWIDRLDNSVRLFAGAVQPDRNEPNWVPRYNVIELSLLDEGRLRILVWPRKWYSDEWLFGPDYDSAARPTRELFHILEQLEGLTSSSLPVTDAHSQGSSNGGLTRRLAQQPVDTLRLLANGLSGSAIGADDPAIVAANLVTMAMKDNRVDELIATLERLEASDRTAKGGD